MTGAERPSSPHAVSGDPLPKAAGDDASRQFDVWMAERSFRFKEEALYSHAPQAPGIYQLVTFDAQGNGTILYIALTLDKSIFDALYEHWRGERQPAVQDLLARYPSLYFGYVASAPDAKTPEDWKDLYYAMVQAEKPTLQKLDDVKPTGRYSEVTYKDKSIL
jgi:hypothetical protein